MWGGRAEVFFLPRSKQARKVKTKPKRNILKKKNSPLFRIIVNTKKIIFFKDDIILMPLVMLLLGIALAAAGGFPASRKPHKLVTNLVDVSD